MKENSCILMDFGCKYKGYCSDITRTLYFGQPDSDFIKAYDAVLSANVIAEEEIFAGEKVSHRNHRSGRCAAAPVPAAD